jgi:predicted PurR-regulated permease PerM
MSTDRIAAALSLAALAGLLYLLFLVFQPFLFSLGWAAVLAIVFYPMHAELERRWGASRGAAATTAAATVLVVGPLLLVMTAFVREAMDGAASLQDALAEGRLGGIERGWRSLAERIPFAQRVDVVALVTDAAKQGAVVLAAQSGALLRNVAGFVFDLVIALFATFFLLRDTRKIMTAVRRILPFDESVREQLITQTRELVSASVTSSGLIAALQGALGGILFAAVGIGGAVFWGVVMAFMSLIPLGAWVVWLPAAILLAISGSPGRGLIVAGAGFGIVSAVDNVLRPMMMSGGTRMNGLLILIALLGGVAAFGMLGLVLGPILVATVLALLKVYIAHGAGKPDKQRPPDVIKV